MGRHDGVKPHDIPVLGAGGRSETREAGGVREPGRLGGLQPSSCSPLWEQTALPQTFR